MVIAAIGQAPDLSCLDGDGIQVTKNGAFDVNSDLATSKEGIFAAGDNVRGPATVVEAIADGKKAALSIDKCLGGDGIFKDAYHNELVKMAVTYNEEAYQKEMERIESPQIAVTERISNFNEVVLAYPVQMAIEEARRCLHCYRRDEE
jgi:NADPH-dependent glutamate synthase beta subunit-like oxidoreductase